MMRDGFLVIKREPIQITFKLSDNSLQKLDACANLQELGLSIHDIHRHYHGFEGNSWPYFELYNGKKFEINYLVPFEKYSDIISYIDYIKHDYSEDQIDCLYLSLSKDVKTNNFQFLGVEYGSYISIWNHFSIIFHEIIFGYDNRMKSFRKYLNKNLLLPIDYNLFLEIKETREKLWCEGVDLETFETEEEIPIPIFIYRLNI